MAVIRARSLDCPGFLILSLLLLGAGRVLCEGNPESTSGGAPTVSQCRPHIEAALKDFVTHHNPQDEQSSLRDRPTEEALHAGEQSELDTNQLEEDLITDKGDTIEDTAKETEQDEDATQAEGDGDDDNDEGTEGADDDEATEGADDDEETEGAEDSEKTDAEGATEAESKKDDDDDEQTVAEGEDQTEDDDDDNQTVDEQDEKTEGDEGTAGEEGDTEGDDEKSASEGGEETAAEDDEDTAAEGDEETAAEGDEGDDDKTATDGEATEGGDETATGDDGTAGDEGTAGDDEPTVAEETGEAGEEEDDEETETGGGEGDTAEVEGDETGGQSKDDETDGVAGEDDKDDDETKAEGAESEDEGEEEGDATEGDDETAQAAATEDETKEGEEAGTAEDVSEAAETQGAEADEPSGDDGQQSGEDAADKEHGTEEDVSEPAATEGDECEGEGESEADEPEEEEETKAETEARVKPSRGDLRSRSHIDEILGLDDASISSALSTEKLIQNILKDLKRMYESAIKPMELLYKFKDISNRYVGDSEIFSKPMILFIGPWSSGKSTIVNYLLDIEDTTNALPTGAEPKSSDFTVLTYGDSEVMLGGTELAADWTFSTMQKFGQAFLDQLKGMKLPNNLLRKITIVDTPGILENRKIQERTYPFNDVCQWFIDRADIIYVVFDPTKLDMGLEMEALFDQLKGREAQVRIVLNKADTVSPQELMRVQSTLLWNLSPLFGSSEAPTIFVGNFWSRPYVRGSPSLLFEAQEEALLQDLRHVIVGRVENKISFTRRHAVRVRNHAKMVDCYLNTYYNHKTFFGNKKKVADDIIENPQSYHIYEGLSTLTNVSRYDLPDPDIYREFFKVNPLYEFKQLASTCSFFKGCPLDKLDLTISYELPELMGKYRKLVGASAHGAGGDRR